MNLILDPCTHMPHLKKLIPNSLYYTENKHSTYPAGQYTEKEFHQKYNFDYNEDISKIEKNEIKNLFIVIPVLGFLKEAQGNNYIDQIKKFTSVFDKVKHLPTGKIIIFDNHAYDYDPYPFVKFMKPDIILKRIFTKRIYQLKNTYSYPFSMCTINDPFYKIINSEISTPSEKISKIIWSGSLFEHRCKIEKVCDEYTNRKKTLHLFQKKYKNLIDVKKVPYNQFLPMLNSYKYSLDLRGCSRLNKRLFEILSTNSLLLAEKIDVVWPFEEGDNFSEECFFEQGNVDDLYRIYKIFENDDELYDRCLENQKFIVKKYFNKEWLWKYIENIITI